VNLLKAAVRHIFLSFPGAAGAAAAEWFLIVVCAVEVDPSFDATVQVSISSVLLLFLAAGRRGDAKAFAMKRLLFSSDIIMWFDMFQTCCCCCFSKSFLVVVVVQHLLNFMRLCS
jgi:hypothetical protein